jgi:hypothetical protein
MNRKIIDRLREEFLFVGDEKISGKTAISIIDRIIEENTIPKEVEDAQKYVRECHADMGFCGSPEYYRQKKIVDDYFEKIQAIENEKKEKEEYLRLRKKYGE